MWAVMDAVVVEAGRAKSALHRSKSLMGWRFATLVPHQPSDGNKKQRYFPDSLDVNEYISKTGRAASNIAATSQILEAPPAYTYTLLEGIATQLAAENQSSTNPYRRIRGADLLYSVIAKSDRNAINGLGLIYEALSTEYKRQIFGRQSAEYQALTREKFAGQRHYHVLTQH